MARKNDSDSRTCSSGGGRREEPLTGVARLEQHHYAGEELWERAVPQPKIIHVDSVPAASPPEWFTQQSRLIRVGSWPAAHISRSLAAAMSRLYENPTIKINTSNVTRRVIGQFGIKGAFERFQEAEKGVVIPFVASGIVPFTRHTDNTFHLSLAPDHPTKSALRIEGERIEKILGLDYPPDLDNLIVASFKKNEKDLIRPTADSLLQFINSPNQGQPHLLLAPPSIRHI